MKQPETPLAVAVSGGADSLLALALLQEAGHRLLAVHGRFFAPDAAALQREQALERQCAVLGIPLHILDVRREFRQLVIAPFAQAYAAGYTPNPCGLCNPRVKFGLLLDKCRELGAGGIATGHYARRTPYTDSTILLCRGKDPGKDQSYFMSMTPPDRLALAHFPLGETFKEQTLDALRVRGLEPPNPTASREICFIPDNDYRRFLQQAGRELSLDLPGEGPIVLKDGNDYGRVVGRHQGLWRHTLGQRRGLGVAWKEPLYVLGKDMAGNALIVGPEHEQYTRVCAARDCVIHLPRRQWPAELLVQTRYRQKAAPADVELSEEDRIMRVVFHAPHALPAPGQLAVAYTPAGHVLAAGVIDSVGE